MVDHISRALLLSALLPLTSALVPLLDPRVVAALSSNQQLSASQRRYGIKVTPGSVTCPDIWYLVEVPWLFVTCFSRQVLGRLAWGTRKLEDRGEDGNGGSKTGSFRGSKQQPETFGREFNFGCGTFGEILEQAVWGREAVWPEIYTAETSKLCGGGRWWAAGNSFASLDFVWFASLDFVLNIFCKYTRRRTQRWTLSQE